MSETQHCVSVFPAGLLEPQIAKQNCTAGKPAPIGLFEAARKQILTKKAAASERPTGGAWGGQDSVRPPDEDAIWRSEMRLKKAAGNTDTQCCVSDMSDGGPLINI